MSCKAMLLLIVFSFSFKAFSQDASKMKQIDSLVNLINGTRLIIQNDTIKQEFAELGLSIRTYLKALTDTSGLRKYVNEVHVKRTENGVATEKNSTSSFYFDKKKLIKVEETATLDDKQFEALWYYADDKPLYYPIKTEQGEERAVFLLTLAKSMIEKIKP